MTKEVSAVHEENEHVLVTYDTSVGNVHKVTEHVVVT